MSVRAYYSRSGHRIPNPYVDNARPNQTTTWATVGGRHVKVMVGWFACDGVYFFAFPQGHPGIRVRAIGPSEAVAKLDKTLSKQCPVAR